MAQSSLNDFTIMSRRLFWALCSLLIIGWFGFHSNLHANSDVSESYLTTDVLQKTLYAKTDAENNYCQFVIDCRSQGTLPNRILYAAYRYAMKKEKDRRFTYFQQSLVTLCKRENIVLENAPTTENGFFSFSSGKSAQTKAMITKANLTKTNAKAPEGEKFYKKPFTFFSSMFQR